MYIEKVTSMNLKTYFKEIKEKINKINSYVSNPFNYKNIDNPFAKTQTYIWLEKETKNNYS